MNVIIVGNGSVGETLIDFISQEGHSVTVVDEDAAEVSKVVNKYDVFGVCGNGASVSVQKEAGAPTCDVIIAVTPGDELNLLSCMIAKKLGAKHAIARVRDPRYLKQTAFMSSQLGIDMIVNPEFEAAREAARLIRFPAAMKLEKFAQGQVEMVEIHIGKGHPFVDLPIIDFKSKFDTSALICVAERGDEVIIPDGDFIIRDGDSIFITASRKDITDLFVRIGLIRKQIKDVLLIGGDKISRYLATALVGDGYNVKIVEQDSETCEELAELFPKATIACGNPNDPDVLEDEGLDGTGACVVMTQNDQSNLLISMYARTKKVDKIITKISSPTFAKLSDSAGIDSNITPHLLSSAKVLRYIRGLANKGEKGYKSEIKTLFKLADGKVEALEFDVADDFEYTGIALRDLNPKLKKNILIGAIIRAGVVIYPHGNTTLEVGDKVVIITKNASLCDLDDIIA